MGKHIEDTAGYLTKGFETQAAPKSDEDNSCALLEDTIERSEVAAELATNDGMDDTAQMWKENGAASQEIYDAVCKPPVPMS